MEWTFTGTRETKIEFLNILGEYYRSNVVEELEETRRVYSQVTPGLPIVTAKAMENVIANDKNLSSMKLNVTCVIGFIFPRAACSGEEGKGKIDVQASSCSISQTV